jgi:Flp pilus assembly protein TadG
MGLPACARSHRGKDARKVAAGQSLVIRTRQTASVIPTASDRRHRKDRSRGQTLAEFAIVFPLFVVIMLGLIEFAFVFNAVLSTNFASRAAALLAAEAGDLAGADCVILNSVEQEMGAPVDRGRITQVSIFHATTSGTQVGSEVTRYTRTGSRTCTYPDGSSLTVPYTRTSNGYPEGSSRCNILAGCGDGYGLHTIGVKVEYDHTWKTPLNNWLPGGSTGWAFARQNAMRMEPIL